MRVEGWGLWPVQHTIVSASSPLVGGPSPSSTAPAWVLSMECSPSGSECPSEGTPWGHKFCQQTCYVVWSLSSGHRSFCPAAQASPRVIASFEGIHLLWYGVLHRLWDLCSTVVLQGLQGHGCLTMICTMGYRRQISVLAHGAPPSCPSSLTMVLLYIISLLSSLAEI